LGLEALQFLQDLAGSLVFELMQLLLKPALGFIWGQAQLTNLTKPFSGVGKIQNADGLGTMKIDKALGPLRAIDRGCHHLSLFDPAPMHFDQGQPIELLGFDPARKVADIFSPDLPLPIGSAYFANLANRQRFHFNPFTPHQRDHRPIDAHLNLGRALGGWR
jgi:hypothetical protein